MLLCNLNPARLFLVYNFFFARSSHNLELVERINYCKSRPLLPEKQYSAIISEIIKQIIYKFAHN